MHKADNLPPSCAVVTKSGNLNFLEPSGPVQACNGTALTLPFTVSVVLVSVISLSFSTNFSLFLILFIYYLLFFF